MKNQWLTLKQLDRQLQEWQIIAHKCKMPQEGWVKTLRKALGMTALQLANRLGLTRARVVQLEEAEQNGAVTLRTLQKVAEAIDAELIYAIVPKRSLHGENPLENIIKEQAEKIAAETITRVAHSMSLENQSVGKKREQEQKNELIKELLEGSLKRLWKNK